MINDEHSSLCEKIDALHIYDEEEYEKLETKRKEVSSRINAIPIGEGEEQVAKEISKKIYSNLRNSEDGAEYEGEHLGYEYIATKFLQGHVENGGDEYGGYWEEVGVTDSEEYVVEIYSPSGSRQYILEAEVKELLTKI